MNNESRPAQGDRDLSVLLVDDDVELCDLMREFFSARGMAIEAIHDGRLGLSRALGGGHDLILLDVMLPGLDGFELLRQVRRRSLVPIIMLTARTARADRVAGLDAGRRRLPAQAVRAGGVDRPHPRRPPPYRPVRARRSGCPRGQWRQADAGHARGLVRRHPRRSHDDRVRHPRADRPLGRPDHLPERAVLGDLPAPRLGPGSLAGRACQPPPKETGRCSAA